MRAGDLEILPIIALLVTRAIDFTTGETTTSETPIDKSTNDSDDEPPAIGPPKSAISRGKNENKNNNLRMDYWMARMGTMQADLINVQAIVVKDEDAKGTCDQADRKSNKRYLMCAGSILNRNHVLSSASCLHEATHIRHNIRGPLAVVVAPLKQSIQVIRVTEYKIHPGHRTNPYSRDHLTHNVAILKLACRIDMENYVKVELPVAPFVQTCSEDNCVVAIYRKTGTTSNVMYQILAPNIPFPNRRRKQTMVKDGGARRSLHYRPSEITDDATERRREKRKFAEPPVFVSGYELRKRMNDSSSKFTTESSIGNSTVVTSTLKIANATESNSTEAPPARLDDDEYKAWTSPTVGNETIKSIVVRSSDGYRSCARTGSAVMSNKTQAALASVPCDDRQQSAKWLYTDLWDNVEWIREILQDWSSNVSAARPAGAGPADARPAAGPGGNYSGCSTCIFNFFIEIGCKDKNRCGNRSASGLESASGLASQSLGCSGGNSIGIEVGIGGPGCDKRDAKSDTRKRAEYRGMPGKPIVDRQFGLSGKSKNLPNAPVDGVAKLQLPVTGSPVKITFKDNSALKNKYPSEENAQVGMSRPFPKTATIKNTNLGGLNNEIGMQNIESDSIDWLAEVEKGLDSSSDAKREYADARRSA